jgi:hypothetical protein
MDLAAFFSMMLKKNGYAQVFNAGKWSNLLG